MNKQDELRAVSYFNVLISIIVLVILGFVLKSLNGEAKEDIYAESYNVFFKPVEVAFLNREINAYGYNDIADYVWSAVSSPNFGSDSDCEELTNDVRGAIDFYQAHPDYRGQYFNDESWDDDK